MHIDGSLLSVIICLCIINVNASKIHHIIGLKVGRRDIIHIKIGSPECVAVLSCCSLCISVVTVCYADAPFSKASFFPTVYLCVIYYFFNNL